jgi:hypothetical protein
MRGVIVSNRSNRSEVIMGISLGRQRGLADSSEVIDQLMHQREDARAEYATRLTQARAESDREIAALRHELVSVYQEVAYLRGVVAFHRSERDPDARLN